MTMRRLLVALVIAAGAAIAWWDGRARLGAIVAPETHATSREDPITPEDRALAAALLLDSPRPAAVIDEGLQIAERLRRRFGIDTGHRHADRLAAARRAQAELERATFTPEELRAAARALGHDLDACGTWCRNVARLAELELRKRVLRQLAAG